MNARLLSLAFHNYNIGLSSYKVLVAQLKEIGQLQ